MIYSVLFLNDFFLQFQTSSKHKGKKCYNCQAEKTTLWRQITDGKITVCNACGLYYNLHNVSFFIVSNTLNAAVDNEPVLEVTQPCNDQKTCLAGITKSSNLPVRCIQFTTIWICHSLHIMLPFLKTGINYWHFWFQYGWNVNCKYHMLLQTTPVSVDPYP